MQKVKSSECKRKKPSFVTDGKKFADYGDRSEIIKSVSAAVPKKVRPGR